MVVLKAEKEVVVVVEVEVEVVVEKEEKLEEFVIDLLEQEKKQVEETMIMVVFVD